MAESPKRHWNGSIGDRHEHQNVWMNGGARAPAVTGPWAGWDSHRRNSDLSLKSTDSNNNNTNNNNNNNNNGDRGRSNSGTSSALFSTLTTQKRNSTDPSMLERRKSYSDQLPMKGGGIFGSWWHYYTRGH